MCSKEQCIDLLLKDSSYLQSEFGIRTLKIFGSMARGEATDKSDVDIYVEMPPTALKIIDLKEYLQNLLGRKIDIVRSHSHLDSFLKQEIIKDGLTIF